MARIEENLILDEFLGGIATDGQIGQLGWRVQNGSAVYSALDGARIGVLKRSTGTTANTVATLYFSGNMRIDNLFQTVWEARLLQTDGNTRVRFGFSSAAAGNPPANGLYFEKTQTDTNWFAVARAASVETRVDTGIVVDTGWHSFLIQRLTDADASIEFVLDDALVATVTTNLPTGVDLLVWSYLTNWSASVNKEIEYDNFQMRFLWSR